jgi:hypothetical protein
MADALTMMMIYQMIWKRMDPTALVMMTCGLRAAAHLMHRQWMHLKIHL